MELWNVGKATRWLSWYDVGLASADRVPVVVRIPAGPLGSLKCDPPKGNGRRPQKNGVVKRRKLHCQHGKPASCTLRDYSRTKHWHQSMNRITVSSTATQAPPTSSTPPAWHQLPWSTADRKINKGQLRPESRWASVLEQKLCRDSCQNYTFLKSSSCCRSC